MKLLVEETETPTDPVSDAKEWAKETENPLLKFTPKQLAEELVRRSAFIAISGLMMDKDGNTEPLRIMHGDLMQLYAHTGTMFDAISARMTAVTMGAPTGKIVRPR